MKPPNIGLNSILAFVAPIMEMAGEFFFYFLCIILKYICHLGISMDRFILHKDVFADEVYLPRYGGCQDPVYNTWELLSMRKFFYDKLQLPTSISPSQIELKPTKKPIILLISRSAKAKFSRNKGDPVRLWSNEFIARFQQQLESYFPDYEVKLFSDKDEELMKCFLCQVKLFSETSVLIGIHGAGFANQIFMKPNR